MKNSDCDLCCKFLRSKIKVISCNVERRDLAQSTFSLTQSGAKLTQILQAVAGLVESPSIELQSDDGEDEDSEEEKKGDVNQRTDSLAN